MSFLTYPVGTVLSCVVPCVHCGHSYQLCHSLGTLWTQFSALCRSLRTLWAQFSAVSFLTYTVDTVLSCVSFLTYTVDTVLSCVSFLTLCCTFSHRHHAHHKLPSSTESNFARNDGGVNWDFYSSGEFFRQSLRTSFVFLSLFLFLFCSLGRWGWGPLW